MEEGTEVQKERFITLVSPEDKLQVTLDGFSTADKRIPELGVVSLVGSNDFDYDDAELGIAVVEDRVVIDKANSFKKMGFLETFVYIDNRGPQDSPLACKMVLPKDDIVLESDEMLAIADVLPEDHPEVRYRSSTTRWKMKGDNKRLAFFTKADTKFLSRLRFSFGQIHNPLKN